MREIKVGEVFEHESVKLECVKDGRFKCRQCYFRSSDCELIMCRDSERKDGEDVFFIEVKE
jgi:hypothetical protein